MFKTKNIEQYTQDFNVLISIDFKKLNETIKKLQKGSELSLIPSRDFLLQNEKILINVTLSKIRKIYREMEEFSPDSKTKIITIFSSLKIFATDVSSLDNSNTNKLSKIITTYFI